MTYEVEYRAWAGGKTRSISVTASQFVVTDGDAIFYAREGATFSGSGNRAVAFVRDVVTIRSRDE